MCSHTREVEFDSQQDVIKEGYLILMSLLKSLCVSCKLQPKPMTLINPPLTKDISYTLVKVYVLGFSNKVRFEPLLEL